MKLSHRITALVSAVLLLLPLTGCGDNPQQYRYRYDLSDYITLGEYKGIPADVPETKITDEQVQQDILSTVLYFSKEEEVDRASKTGDTVKYTCTATLDGENVPALAEEDGSLVLGFETHGAKAEKALTGVKAGATVTADRVIDGTVTKDEALLGKTATYTYTITGVYESKAPEYNDLFVKAYFGFDSVADYEAAIRAKLEATAEQNYVLALVNQTWPVLLENTTVLSYPEKEFNQIYDQIILEVETYTGALGLDFDAYTELKFGMGEEEFREYAKELAEIKVKEEMIVYAIVRAEDLTISDELYQEYVQMYMEQLGFSTQEELEARYTRGAICEGAFSDLVKEFVARNAQNGAGAQ